MYEIILSISVLLQIGLWNPNYKYIHGPKQKNMQTHISIRKPISLLILLFLGIIGYAQEPIWLNSSEIKEVKLYQTGAMVSRTGKAQVNSGLQEVVFDGLSPYINPESITLKGIGDAVILNVSFQQNYLMDRKKSKDVTNLEELLDSLTYRTQLVQNKIATLNELQNVLLANKAIGGATNGVIADELELVVEYFNKKSLAIKNDILEYNQTIKKLNDQVTKIKQQLDQLNIKKNEPVGNIIVSLDSKLKGTINFELSYVIGSNASWYSFYDLRAKDVNSPIELVCKAKVNQNTGEDWKNVKLKLNTGNPSQSAIKPELYPWYLNLFVNQPIMYKTQSNVPMAAGARMEEDVAFSKEVKLQAVQVQVNQNQLSSDFEIMSPYSIPSDGKEYQVDIQKYNLKASYNYEAIPKLDADAFLTAKITSWEDLSLTAGSANVYFDGAYVGATYFDPSQTGDTLTVSLGRDKRITIKREKLKDLSGSKLFGGNRERSFTYEISIKNGKKEPISLFLFDQVPVSNAKEIEVKMGDNSGADYDTTNGNIRWNLTVQPGETIKKNLSFSVKYPKDKQVVGL